MKSNKTPPATPQPFKPWKPHPHPRQAEIEQGQPPMITPNGYGGYSRSWGGKEGAK